MLTKHQSVGLECFNQLQQQHLQHTKQFPLEKVPYKKYTNPDNVLIHFVLTSYPRTFLHPFLKTHFRAHMKLTIKNLSLGDFGNYRCISKNSLGETEGSIRVYGKSVLPASPRARARAATA